MDLSNLPAILTPDLGLLFWMMLAFLVVFFVLAKKGFPAIVNMVEERKAYIDESLKKAHEANEKLANIQAEGEKILLEARERQSQIVKEAQATRDNMIAQAEVKAVRKARALLQKQKLRLSQRRRMPSLTSVSRFPFSVWALPRRYCAKNFLTTRVRWLMLTSCWMMFLLMLNNKR